MAPNRSTTSPTDVDSEARPTSHDRRGRQRRRRRPSSSRTPMMMMLLTARRAALPRRRSGIRARRREDHRRPSSRTAQRVPRASWSSGRARATRSRFRSRTSRRSAPSRRGPAAGRGPPPRRRSRSTSRPRPTSRRAVARLGRRRRGLPPLTPLDGRAACRRRACSPARRSTAEPADGRPRRKHTCPAAARLRNGAGGPNQTQEVLLQREARRR